MKAKKPRKSAEELNLERAQREELADQESEIGLKKSFLNRGGRRSLLSGSERGTLG